MCKPRVLGNFCCVLLNDTHSCPQKPWHVSRVSDTSDGCWCSHRWPSSVTVPASWRGISTFSSNQNFHLQNEEIHLFYVACQIYQKSPRSHTLFFCCFINLPGFSFIQHTFWELMVCKHCSGCQESCRVLPGSYPAPYLSCFTVW